MNDHDSPISINKGGTTLAKTLVSEDGGHWPVPEGTILASGVRRITSFVLDTIIAKSISGTSNPSSNALQPINVL